MYLGLVLQVGQDDPGVGAIDRALHEDRRGARHFVQTLAWGRQVVGGGAGNDGCVGAQLELQLELQLVLQLVLQLAKLEVKLEPQNPSWRSSRAQKLDLTSNLMPNFSELAEVGSPACIISLYDTRCFDLRARLLRCFTDNGPNLGSRLRKSEVKLKVKLGLKLGPGFNFETPYYVLDRFSKRTCNSIFM
ncbi:hypothetical protein B0H14DRAFT_2594995 [Mycena olivaceomarginata]|nr:hypothetical protein B0H14DRAFT_2594995 [Mycena olivaceomarginata]